MTTFQRELIALAPTVRTYALVVCRKGISEADDLVQETFEKAWRARDQFQPGTSMKAWLFTILRNAQHNRWRRSRREMEDPDGQHAATLKCGPAQPWRVELTEALDAIARLDADSRQALLLIAAGLSYEEAADVCGCHLRTLQSRVRRARLRMALGLSSTPSLATA